MPDGGARRRGGDRQGPRVRAAGGVVGADALFADRRRRRCWTRGELARPSACNATDCGDAFAAGSMGPEGRGGVPLRRARRHARRDRRARRRGGGAAARRSAARSCGATRARRSMRAPRSNARASPEGVRSLDRRGPALRTPRAACRSRSDRDGLALRRSDCEHPSAAGAYLARRDHGRRRPAPPSPEAWSVAPYPAIATSASASRVRRVHPHLAGVASTRSHERSRIGGGDTPRMPPGRPRSDREPPEAGDPPHRRRERAAHDPRRCGHAARAAVHARDRVGSRSSRGCERWRASGRAPSRSSGLRPARTSGRSLRRGAARSRVADRRPTWD